MGALQFAVVTWVATAVTAVAMGAAPGPQGAVSREDSQLPFDLDEVLDGAFSARGLGAVWASPTQLVRRNASGDIEIYDVSNKSSEVLVPNSILSLRSVNTGSWQLTGNRELLLWSYEVKAGFRHSTEAKYSVLHVDNRTWLDLHGGEHLQTAQFSPQGDSIAYVYENNVYYVPDLLTWDSTPKPLTEDGSDDVYNGVPDWVYEEEVLSSGSAMWFSPGGKYLAHAKFNDSEVEEFEYIIYGADQYPTVETLLYPKPGTENPHVLVSVTRLSDNVTIHLDSTTTEYEEPILQHVSWTSDQQILIVWLNRIQNNVTIVSYDVTQSNNVPVNVYNMYETEGWLEVGSPQPINDTAWAMLWPLQINEQRFQRVVIFNDTDIIDRVETESVATAFYGWNTKTGHIFFQAAPEGQPAQRHVYAATDHGDVDVKCLTCDMEQPFNGSSSCLYASASFSTDLSWAAFTCSGPGPAHVRFAEVSNGAVQWHDIWENNTDLLNKLATRSMPLVEANITVAVGDGILAQVRLWLPPNIDRSKKYPMLVFVYGGPGSQQVSNAYSVNWGYHLTTAKNIIYASIDGRGSGYQGSKTLYALYKKLGTVEVVDQIEVTKELVKNYNFIDEERIGIWGWSYGGYATAMAIALDNENVFRCGASVAPVTSWDLYDSIYTERYMDVPDNNKDGYKDANISNKIQNFKTHRFFLLHGNADDNVHYQQAMRLARALEESNVLFAQQSYPDENHSIRSVVKHVYLSLGEFFEQCFETTDGSASVLPALLPALLLPLLTILLA